MRKKHFMGMLATGAAALLLSIVPAACTDEREENPATGGRIGFAIDFWKEGTTAQAARTKGAGTEAGGLPTDTLPAVRVIPLDGEASGDGKTLYLHAVTTDGIGAGTEGGGDAARMATTKAAPVNTATMYDEMAVTAFVYPAADSWPAAYTAGNATPYMSNVKVKKSEAWSTSYYWPGAARKICFFASAPYDCDGLAAFNDGVSGNPPYLSYTVPAAVADQKDLLVAAATDRPGNSNTAVPLTMRHALTAVRFVTGDNMLPGKVSGITLKNVYGRGKLPLTASPAWDEHAGMTNFTQTFSPEATAPDPQSPGTSLTQPEATFMMLPQTLPSNAQIEVIYTDNLTGTQRTLTANIAGKTWPMGNTVTYRISTSSIVVVPKLDVTAPGDFEHMGGTLNYTVASYLEVTRLGDPTKTVAAPWTVEYSTDNGGSWSGTKPAWLTAFTESGVGGNTPEEHQATVEAQVKVMYEPNNDNLRAAAPKTNWNLSNATGADAVQNTANCYVVNAPGTYRLPLVYGNAIKNGAPNASAYTSTASADSVLTPFINHDRDPITAPYIYDNGLTAADCKLVWQDAQNLVTDVKLSTDNHFLEFSVKQENIRQGNAVVAVRNAANTVLWSWHIWVTDYVLGTDLKTITNFQGNPYTIMPVNLGWCDEEKTTYAERTVQVRFRQTGTSATPQIITVKQKAHEIKITGNNTYYQWGRKDPFVGCILDGSKAKNKTWYDGDGNPKIDLKFDISSFVVFDICIADGIKTPGTFCTSGVMDKKYYNLWSANNTVDTPNDDLVVKTVYDPCPVGYKMPPSNVFTGFSTTGNDTQTFSECNVQGAWDNGWNFYCSSSKTETVFFPASGYRSNGYANPTNVGTFGFYWSAEPKGTHSGKALSFSQKSVNLSSYYRGFGNGVRPCQE